MPPPFQSNMQIVLHLCISCLLTKNTAGAESQYACRTLTLLMLLQLVFSPPQKIAGLCGNAIYVGTMLKLLAEKDDP